LAVVNEVMKRQNPQHPELVICHLVGLLDTAVHPALLVSLTPGQFTGYWNTPCTVG